MLKDEINLMLLSLMDNNFKRFYKTGYFSYSKDKSFKGAVAIVNDKAIVSFLQNVDDENEVIATASFHDHTAVILQLMDNDFSRIQFGKLPRRYSLGRESVISEIASIRKRCAEAEERLASGKFHSIKSIFSKASQPASEKLSKQDVRFLLENTLEKLHKSQNLNNRNEISPKVETTNAVNSSTPIIDPTILDKTQEI